MPRRAPLLTCSVPECERPHEARGLCQMHYFRVRRSTPLGAAARRTRGPGAGTTSYRGAHKRVYAAKGKAASHSCADCGDTATHWSYEGPSHGEEQLSSKGLRYSSDPRDYLPRCTSCHLIYDRSEIRKRDS